MDRPLTPTRADTSSVPARFLPWLRSLHQTRGRFKRRTGDGGVAELVGLARPGSGRRRRSALDGVGGGALPHFVAARTRPPGGRVDSAGAARPDANEGAGL